MRIIAIEKIFFLALLLMVSSCSGSQNREKNGGGSAEIPLETYINVNRKLVEREQEKIKEYVSENDLNMEKTGTGMWYRIDKQGDGEKVKQGKIINLEFQISLLDGTVCYDSKDDGTKEFLVGQGGVESGLEEGVLMLNEGAKAQFIMPPHLAHGLVGDDDRIPSRAIIVYEVEVVDVKEK